MVGGRLRCLGSTQHLKSTYGSGYFSTFKLSPPDEITLNGLIARMGRCLDPSSRLRRESLADACTALGMPARVSEINPAGSGWAVAAALDRDGYVSGAAFAEWWASEASAAGLHAFLTSSFPGASVVERHGDHVRYSLPKTSPPAPLSTVFSLLENAKARLGILEYSASEPSLEQIFNAFASAQTEEKGAVRGMVSTNSSSAGTAAGAKAEASGYAVLAAGGK